MSTSRDSRLSIQPRSPKALLENSACSEIDGALKTLKVLNRSVLATLGLWQDEARVLERLYYKGKNQHRSAIFWQKTAEMRRFAMRIQGADTPGVIEGIRLSFFSVSAAPDAKLLKGSWTHFPAASSLLITLKQLSDISLLIQKARERFAAIYQCYTSALRDGYFVHLLLVLVAVSARLDALLVDLTPNVLSISSAVLSMARAIDPDSVYKTKYLSSLVESAPLPPLRPLGDQGASESVTKMVDVHDEDVGNVVSRATSTTHLEYNNQGCSSSDRYPGEIRLRVAGRDDLENTRQITSWAPPPPASTSATPTLTVVKKKRRQGEDSQRSSASTQSKKKRMKKDDIDAIFDM